MHGFQHGISRRGLLTLGLITAMTGAMPVDAFASLHRSLAPSRSLSFYNTHTGENLCATYWCKGRYVTDGLTDIDRILRDYRTGEVIRIDVTLLDLLYLLRARLDSREPFHIISGYRSEQTNNLLRETSQGVARNSLHTCGKAIDIRLPGRGLERLHTAAVTLKGGGVGYYPASDFIHVDVGRVRYW